ncbi:MAG: bifunctional DNA-formamidopyrimidine glycosylase/DNA-(apurinic or apyrimidinic site) lyase [Planctomycetes bacterium]|nr:bifunctional DNA-formamidopyrimidine glycosylase/DNA-(apurinic or apyrimidinic site) lyase [Planctomycetota bacterium]
MPELPEVENIAVGLRHEIVGLYTKKIYIKKPSIIQGPLKRSWKKTTKNLTGSQIITVTRRAKRLILCTDNNLSLLFQLGMTGKFLISSPNSPKEKHAHILINFSDNKQLRFIDPRRFGRLWLVENLDPKHPDLAMRAAGLTKLGPEPDKITLKQFQQILNTQRVIKNLLLDQTRIAGPGNIYADESLYATHIHPNTPSSTLNDTQARQLRNAIRRILKRAIAYGGTTFSDFRNPYGDMGRFWQFIKVYQKNNSPCPRCRTKIQKIVISNRSAHFCPQCQPLK